MKKKGSGKIIVGAPLGVLLFMTLFNGSKNPAFMVIFALFFFSLAGWGWLQRRNPEVQRKFEEQKLRRKAEYEEFQEARLERNELEKREKLRQQALIDIEKDRQQREKRVRVDYKKKEQQMPTPLLQKGAIPSPSTAALSLTSKTIRPSSDGGWTLNPQSSFPLTVNGLDSAVAEKLLSILENKPSEGTYYITKSVLPIVARYNISCKEIDDYIRKFKPVYLRAMEDQVQASTEWSTASELDKADMLKEFKENATTSLDIRPDCDLAVLFDGDQIDITIDDVLIDTFGHENIDFYLSRKEGVHIVPSDHYNRKKFEGLVEAGLAMRGENIPPKAIVERLKLKEISTLLSDLNPPKFSRKGKAVEYLLQQTDLNERLNKTVSFRSLFQLQPLPEPFANIDLKKVNLSWQYARTISELIVETYFSAENAMQQQQRDINNEFINGWQIASGDDCCSYCKRAAAKKYSKKQYPRVPLHIGCNCTVIPLCS